MAGSGFEVRRLSGSIGAEILGIDLASEPGDNAIVEIRQIWREHNVIFFRDQDLPPAKFLAFAKRFGEVVEYPFIKGIDGFAEIIPVIKLEHNKEFRRHLAHRHCLSGETADGDHADPV